MSMRFHEFEIARTMTDQESQSPNTSPSSSSSPSDSSPPPPPSDSSPPPPPSDSSPPPPPSDSSTPPPSSDSSPPPPSISDSSPPSTSDSSPPSPPPPSSSSPSPPSSDGNDANSPPSPPTVQVTATSPSGSKSGVRRVPPPPPQVSNGTVPPLTDKSSFSPNSSGSSSSLKSGQVAVVAAIIGVGIVLLVIVIVCMVCSAKRKKKNKNGGEFPSHGWESGPNKYNHGGNQNQQISPQYHSTIDIPSASASWGGPGMGENNSQPPSPSLALGFNKSSFTYEDLAAATNGFDKSRLLGQGGFGFVHKGVFPNGKVVAIKSLKAGSGQGEREFQAEVDIISRIHHRHLVSLVGFCMANGQRMLVYEFVANDTLEYHLHKELKLDFSTRLRIALGSAKGLSYLHEDCHPRIIHRDIKSSNILLDENFEAMVADFGLAKLTTDTNTHVSTRVMGTFGYLAPEYASSGKLTEKSDVFSFGVMLLELITGRRPVDPNMEYMEDSLVDWSRPLLAKALETGNFDEIADPRLEKNYDAQEMKRMVACAATSIRHSAKKRPKMSQIVRALEGDVSLDDLNSGEPKGGKTLDSPDGSSDYDTRAYSADLKKFRQMAFATQDFASGNVYDGTTSENGVSASTNSRDTSIIREMHS